MKLYCYYTRAYQILVDEWFFPSAREEYEVILKQGEKSQSVDYKGSAWNSVTREKVDFIIEAVRDSWNDTFLFSDPDVQFFKHTKKEILSFIKTHDVVFQRNSPKRYDLCTGFFVCRGNDSTMQFWNNVRADMERNNNNDDQDCAINLLVGHTVRKVHDILKMRGISVAAGVKLSQCGLNLNRIKWRYFPARFYCGGTYTGKRWSLGMDLPIPANIVIHHANWTVGLEHKIAQLQYVKKIVQARVAR